MVATDDDAFESITGTMEDPITISLTEREDWATVDYDLSGTEDLDKAIAVTLKGLVLMVLDAIEFFEWVGEEGDDEDDDEPDETLT